MMISRRLFGGLAGGAMFGARPAIEEATRVLMTCGQDMQGGGESIAASICEAVDSSPGVIVSKMEKSQAMRMIKTMQPDVWRALESDLFQRNHNVHSIDPDIMVMRSFSPMAKLAFQRQRIVNNEMNNFTRDYKIENTWRETMQNLVHKLMAVE